MTEGRQDQYTLAQDAGAAPASPVSIAAGFSGTLLHREMEEEAVTAFTVKALVIGQNGVNAGAIWGKAMFRREAGGVVTQVGQAVTVVPDMTDPALSKIRLYWNSTPADIIVQLLNDSAVAIYAHCVAQVDMVIGTG